MQDIGTFDDRREPPCREDHIVIQPVVIEAGGMGPDVGKPFDRHDIGAVRKRLDMPKTRIRIRIAPPEEQAQANIDQRVADGRHFPVEYGLQAGLVQRHQAIVEMEIAMDDAGVTGRGSIGQQPVRHFGKQRQFTHMALRAHRQPAFDLPLDERVRAAEIGGQQFTPVQRMDGRKAAHHLDPEPVDRFGALRVAGRQFGIQRDALDPAGDGEGLAQDRSIAAPCHGARHRRPRTKRLDDGIFALDPRGRLVRYDIDRRMAQHQPALTGFDQPGNIGIAAGDLGAEPHIIEARRFVHPGSEAFAHPYRLHIRPPSVKMTEPVM